jgi:hypothetical protein
MGIPSPTSTHASDTEGTSHLKVAAILGIIVQAMVWGGFLVFYLIYTGINSAATTLSGTTSLPSWITVNTVYLAVGLLAGGLVIGIIGYIFFFLGFRAIKRGAPDFGGPTALMIVGLIGFAMMAGGFALFIGTFVSAINSAATSASVSIDITALLSAVALLGLGVILAFVGVIGVVLGNWRAGRRFDETTIRVGGILTIIPYVSIVGYILLLVGYSKAGRKLNSGWSPGAPYGSAPMPPMPPPAGPGPSP